MIRAADLVRYAKDCLIPGGKQGGYIFGAHGQLCTRKVREDCAMANPEQAHKILVNGARWDGHYVWDCSGIMRGAHQALSRYKSGGATTIFTKWCSVKGTIDTLPDVPGTYVCVGTPANMSHIGVYVGEGRVVDARGTAYGVLLRPIDDHKWTHWCQDDEVDFSGGLPAADERLELWIGTVKTRTGNGISLWADNTKRVSVRSIPEGAALDVLETPDHKGFALCRFQGTTGLADLQYVHPQDGEDSHECVYRAQVVGVNIGLNLRTTPAKIENTILLIPPKAEVEVFEGAETKGFAKVRYETITGYCTASYLKTIEAGPAGSG